MDSVYNGIYTVHYINLHLKVQHMKITLVSLVLCLLGYITVKKVSSFPIPGRDVKLSLAGKNLIIPGQGEFGKCYHILAGEGKTATFFLQCNYILLHRLLHGRHCVQLCRGCPGQI